MEHKVSQKMLCIVENNGSLYCQSIESHKSSSLSHIFLKALSAVDGSIQTPRAPHSLSKISIGTTAKFSIGILSLLFCLIVKITFNQWDRIIDMRLESFFCKRYNVIQVGTIFRQLQVTIQPVFALAAFFPAYIFSFVLLSLSVYLAHHVPVCC